MAIHYNLSKVFALSDNDTEFAKQLAMVFVAEVPQDLEGLKNGIKEKNHQQAYSFAHKIKPTLDLLGMTVAHEEILIIEQWAKNKGKRKEIKETFKSMKDRVKKAVKELKKDLNI